jgi:hypothetical protein
LETSPIAVTWASEISICSLKLRACSVATSSVSLKRERPSAGMRSARSLRRSPALQARVRSGSSRRKGSSGCSLRSRFRSWNATYAVGAGARREAEQARALEHEMIGHLPGCAVLARQHHDERRGVDALGLHAADDAAGGVELRLLRLHVEHRAGGQRGERQQAGQAAHVRTEP